MLGKKFYLHLELAPDRQSVTMPRQNADDIELWCLLAGRVCRRGMAVLHLADTLVDKESKLVVNPLRRL